MHKFYWNNTHRGGCGSASNNVSAATLSSASSSSSVSEARKISATKEKFENQLDMDLTPVSVRHHHPEVPARAYGATSIKIGKNFH